MSSDPQLESTRGRGIRFSELRGQVVVVFYEARGHTEHNEDLKQACGRLLSESSGLRERLAVLGVAELAGLGFAPVRSLVRAAVSAAAGRYGTELYLACEGALQRAPYALAGGDSNVAIVDAGGEVVFRARGRLDGGDVDRFFEALSSALSRAGAPFPTAA